MTFLTSVRQETFKEVSPNRRSMRLVASWRFLFEQPHSLWQFWSRQIDLVKWVTVGISLLILPIWIYFRYIWNFAVEDGELIWDAPLDKERKQVSAEQKFQNGNPRGKQLLWSIVVKSPTCLFCSKEAKRKLQNKLLSLSWTAFYS